MERKTGLYVHIPFCIRKCRYCDFLSFPADDETRQNYVTRLREEILRKGDRKDPAGGMKNRKAVSVFFGGGTPSLLSGKQLDSLMEALRSSYDLVPNAEITVECNPGTVDHEKLFSFRESGVNRLSVGIQSADDRELNLLGRIHTWEDAVRCFEEAEECGFDNRSADLMFSLPGQTPENWERTLKRVLKLNPKHISAYSLMIEEGTPFYDLYHEDDLLKSRGERPMSLPDEESDRQMYRMTEMLLGQSGMRRYEISNYAVPGFESIHNCGYWERREYIGFGLGAFSQTAGRRYRNTSVMREYMEGDFGRREELVLSPKEELEETFYLGLRMMKGIDLGRLPAPYKEMLQRYEPVIEQLVEQKLLQRRGSYVALTREGIDISNYVFSQFLLD